MKLLTKEEARILSALVLAVILGVFATGVATWGSPIEGGEDVGGVASGLFERNVIAFELLGALLLAALIGALVLAIRGDDA